MYYFCSLDRRSLRRKDLARVRAERPLSCRDSQTINYVGSAAGGEGNRYALARNGRAIFCAMYKRIRWFLAFVLLSSLRNWPSTFASLPSFPLSFAKMLAIQTQHGKNLTGWRRG